MFVSEKLVFIELHKTGGTHIGRWLAKLVGGEQIGKHNRVPPELWDRFIIGSVRNPWDWYVSLWAYGCGGEGSVHQQTTRRVDLHYLSRQLHSEMGARRLGPVEWGRQLWRDARKPVDAWRAVYRDHTDAGAFRRWLRLIMDPERRFDMGEGYGFSPVARRFGLMTYRYLKLFTRLGPMLYQDQALGTLDGIQQAWEKQQLVNFIIRNERLEPDLLEALSQAGCALSEADSGALRAGRGARTNASKRLPVAHYFDEASVRLVADREAFVIARHGYLPPEISLLSQ